MTDEILAAIENDDDVPCDCSRCIMQRMSMTDGLTGGGSMNGALMPELDGLESDVLFY